MSNYENVSEEIQVNKYYLKLYLENNQNFRKTRKREKRDYFINEILRNYFFYEKANRKQIRQRHLRAH